MSILASLLLDILHFSIFGTSESSTFSSICEFIGQVLITHVQKGNVFNKKRDYTYTSYASCTYIMLQIIPLRVNERRIENGARTKPWKRTPSAYITNFVPWCKKRASACVCSDMMKPNKVATNMLY